MSEELFYSGEKGDLERCQELLNNGADVNWKAGRELVSISYSLNFSNLHIYEIIALNKHIALCLHKERFANLKPAVAITARSDRTQTLTQAKSLLTDQ